MLDLEEYLEILCRMLFNKIEGVLHVTGPERGRDEDIRFEKAPGQMIDGDGEFSM